MCQDHGSIMVKLKKMGQKCGTHLALGAVAKWVKILSEATILFIYLLCDLLMGSINQFQNNVI